MKHRPVIGCSCVALLLQARPPKNEHVCFTLEQRRKLKYASSSSHASCCFCFIAKCSLPSCSRTATLSLSLSLSLSVSFTSKFTVAVFHPTWMITNHGHGWTDDVCNMTRQTANGGRYIGARHKLNGYVQSMHIQLLRGCAGPKFLELWQKNIVRFEPSGDETNEPRKSHGSRGCRRWRAHCFTG
jgi:hypothetical protein